jgi:hypothetical protein
MLLFPSEELSTFPRQVQPDYIKKGVPQATVERRKENVLKEITGFLAEESDLRNTILNLKELMGDGYIEEIVHELHSASERITAVIEDDFGYRERATPGPKPRAKRAKAPRPPKSPKDDDSSESSISDS